MTPTRPPSRWSTAGRALLLLWALLFVCGALGELLHLDALRAFTDVKRIFLR